MLICQRGLLIIIAVCMLHIFFSVSESTAYFILEEKYKEQYQEYLSVFGGQVTEEKKQFLSEEEKQILMEEMLFSEFSNKLYIPIIRTYLRIMITASYLIQRHFFSNTCEEQEICRS